MGNLLTRQELPIPADKLAELATTTFFTEKEIVRLFHIFRTMDKDRNGSISPVELANIKALQFNPFASRVCEIFSSKDDKELRFEDFLDLFSIFSSRSPLDVKIRCAFTLYDFDGDQLIGKKDIIEMLFLVTNGDLLEFDDAMFVADQVIDEADRDGDGALDFSEFNKVLRRIPDFSAKFHIPLTLQDDEEPARPPAELEHRDTSGVELT